MTPIFSRSWLMKIMIVFERLRLAVSLRSAWLISRAWRPTWESPMSPSISARGVSAATESMTTTSSAPERTSMSAISSACSPVSGWLISSCVDVDADRARVGRVHRVLGVDVGADPPVALCLGDDVHRQRRLAGRLRAVDLDDAAAGQATDAEGEVEREGAGGDGLDGHRPLLPHAHDRPLAELLVDGRQGHVQCLVAIRAHCALRFLRGADGEPALRAGAAGACAPTMGRSRSSGPWWAPYGGGVTGFPAAGGPPPAHPSNGAVVPATGRTTAV